MQIKEFRKQAKELAVQNGLKKYDVSITSTSYVWLDVCITCNDVDLFSKLKKDIQNLAGYVDYTKPFEDYFSCKVEVKNLRGENYSGMIVHKSGY